MNYESNDFALVQRIREALNAVMSYENKIQYIRNILKAEEISASKNLMTREEAIERVTEVYSKHCPLLMSRDNAKFQIAVAEALGVLTLASEPVEPNVYHDAVDYLRYCPPT